MELERRSSLRHPIQVPIQVRVAGDDTSRKSQTGDLSEGGLHFYWNRELSRGTALSVTIPVMSRLFQMVGAVVYSQKDSLTNLYRTGVSFEEPGSSFRAKLAEEILRIQKFQEEASRTAGHPLSEEEAARKWIKKYAEKFSEIYH